MTPEELQTLLAKQQKEIEAEMKIVHIDGIPWYRAPVPPRRHKCWAQSAANVREMRVERCACGAIKEAHESEREWARRNERLHERSWLVRWFSRG